MEFLPTFAAANIGREITGSGDGIDAFASPILRPSDETTFGDEFWLGAKAWFPQAQISEFTNLDRTNQVRHPVS